MLGEKKSEFVKFDLLCFGGVKTFAGIELAKQPNALDVRITQPTSKYPQFTF